MKKILLIEAETKNNNRGCMALTYGALKILNDNFNNAEFYSLEPSRKSNSEARKFNINGKERNIYFIPASKQDYYNFFQNLLIYLIFGKTQNTIINTMKSADEIYCIGLGDGLTDNYGIKRLLRFFIEFFIAFCLKKKITLLPQTIGPFNSFLGKILGAFIVKTSDKVFVRDKMANKYLNSIGVSCKEAFDLSVYMEPEKVEINLPDEYIGLNISSLLYCKTDLVNSSDFEFYADIIKRLIDTFLKRGENIVFIPHTYNITDNGFEEDAFAINEIVRDFDSNKIFIIDKNYTAPQLKYIISKSKFFIGSRMHSCFAGLSTSTPTIGLGYSYKFKGGFEMFGIPECAISLKNLKEGQIEPVITQIINLYQDREKIQDTLFNINKKRKYIEL